MESTERNIRIGISSCLLGQAVRCDGGHKRDPFLVETFGQYVEWVPVCPEVEIGLGIPRDTLRLVNRDGTVRLIMQKTGADHTETMQAYSKKRTEKLAGEDLCGYVLKKDSPSCGLMRVRLYDANNVPAKTGRGLYAEALLARFPYLPVEEEGRLCDPRLRENFVERVFAYRRLKDLFAARWKPGDIVDFHSRHKLQLMAHSPKNYTAMGRLVSNLKNVNREEFRNQYESSFMEGLSHLATCRKNTNVLQHIIGYFSRDLDEPSRRELLNVIEDYRNGLIPLVVPLTLIRHYVRVHEVGYLQGQTYLEPHPKELMLRNHV